MRLQSYHVHGLRCIFLGIKTVSPSREYEGLVRVCESIGLELVLSPWSAEANDVPRGSNVVGMRGGWQD